MGSHLFNQMHEMLTLEIENDSDPKVRAELIKEITNGNKQMIQLCQKLEEIIFMELNFGY